MNSILHIKIYVVLKKSIYPIIRLIFMRTSWRSMMLD